ncbi:MAG: hypothetical protein JNL43_15970 [Flavobacteriales bacterium]|nr:hypothetical protein [Flavobacteriales bacterium]
MGSVILAALCVAGFALIFRLFERYAVPLLPAIAINYSVSYCCGLLMAPPWKVVGTTSLLVPAGLLGALFVLIFLLSGLSAKLAGAARTTIAGRMSLVLTIAGAVILFDEQVGPLRSLGIAIALVGLVLVSVTKDEHTSQRSWLLPLAIFLCSGVADIAVTFTQRTLTTPANTEVFPTLCFAASTVVSIIVLYVRSEHAALRQARTWIGGGVLGFVNYASLLFLLRALGSGELPATAIFPLMNIFAILIATGCAILLFRERLSIRQWCGIALCVASLLLIMRTEA